MGYKSNAQRKAVHASKADGGKGAPSKMYKKKSPAKKPLVGKQKNLPDHLKKKILASPAKMNRYNKDMMHERELIYDAKKEIHKEDMAKKKSMAKQTGYVYSEKEMKEGRIRAYLAEQAKKDAKQKKDDITEMDMDQAKIAQYKKDNPKKFKNAADSPAKMSAELKYMPIVDREKSTMSAMGSHKILKHMKGRM